MSVVFSGTFSGRFTSDGTSTFIPLPSGVDWMHVRNETVSYAAGADTGAEFYWQRGDTNGRGTIYVKTTTTNALQVGQIAANSGFFLTDKTINVPGASVALTSISNATPPVVATGSTAGLVNGDIVRIFSTTGAQQLRGIDFTIGSIVSNTSFTLAFMRSIAAATTGTYRRIPYNPYFYPSTRIISKISAASQAIVTMTVTHEYKVGQKIRFVVPTVNSTAFGMTELNGVEATIVAINQADANGVTNTITVDVDTSGFTAFAWPLTAAGDFTPAQIVPVGQNTAESLDLGVDILSDATFNTAQFGMTLAAGTLSPAGAANDVITWVAGKSFNQ